MIEIKKSETADTRTYDFANTSKETLLASSRHHIGDVVKALAFFSSKITEAAGEHDYDKLTTIDWFHADFVTGFKQTGWWDNHRKIHRHHLDKDDGVPADVSAMSDNEPKPTTYKTANGNELWSASVRESSFAAPHGSDAGVESENCGECDRGRVPTWDGDGNETGDEPCQRCDGTGRVEKAKPQPNAEL